MMWHEVGMSEELTLFDPDRDDEVHITPKVIDQLYQDSMRLAEEARSYFDHVGQWDRKRLEPMDRVFFSCESLKVTTRLMHSIAWLLMRKAVQAGEITLDESFTQERRLGRTTPTVGQDLERVKTLPPMAGHLISRSLRLYTRLQRMEAQMMREWSGENSTESPARALLSRIEGAF